MAPPSILNDVLGPVMRGPSSSHTAGSYHIGLVVRALLGEEPVRARFTFDPSGSYASTYREQGVDLAFATALAGKKLTDEGFATALSRARKQGLRLDFRLARLRGADHPNTVEIVLEGASGLRLESRAQSTGGGTFLVDRVNGWPVRLDGRAHEILLFGGRIPPSKVRSLGRGSAAFHGPPQISTREGRSLVSFHFGSPEPGLLRRLGSLTGVERILASPPVYYVQKGRPLFRSAREIVRIARKRRWTLGRAALAYEAELLGLTEKEVRAEILRRYGIMRESVQRGLAGRGIRMQLLRPTAGAVFRAEAGGRLVARSMHTRAAARAMAVMHIDGAMGVVCAAPTGGSAGVIPGALVTIAEERGLSREEVGLALLACGAIGVIVAARSTFAAEVAGCQVEIGAAGAMASAAVVDAVGGSAEQAAQAAAISFQNTMGLVCDLVQGMVEIPCHTRNAVAAASAFVNADLILGGYANPIPLDETIDAVHAVGRAMPKELLCTSRGGLAVTPSALALRAACCAGGCGDCRLGT